jgi:hypothetical protein
MVVSSFGFIAQRYRVDLHGANGSSIVRNG